MSAPHSAKHILPVILSAAIVMIASASVAAAQMGMRGMAASEKCAMSDTAMDHAHMDHAAHMKAMAACSGTLPTMPGQSAFGAISEVVQLLKADPNTDWSRVNIEALRQHLIDMDEVMMHASVVQRAIPGGLEITATGSGRTADAIKRIAVNHTRMLDQSADYRANANPIANGARITVTAKTPADDRTVAMIRGLGFAGLLTEGNHHQAHHLAIARGDADPHGK